MPHHSPPPSPRLSETERSEAADIQHQEYLDSLPVPTLAQIEDITQKQEEKEKVVEEKYDNDEVRRAREIAAGTIQVRLPWSLVHGPLTKSAPQRHFRGHRTRRELSGLSLDPSTRWIEAIKDAQYQNLTTPRQRRPADANNQSQGSAEARPTSSEAKSNWHRVSKIARHAHGEVPELSDHSDTSDYSKASLPTKMTHKHRKHQEEKEREVWKGKMMDLPYFLEMVDLKHRYGSNLRAYHAEWKKADTHENFFYWLDQGEGRSVEIPTVCLTKTTVSSGPFL